MILKKEWPKKGEENLVKLLITAQELSKFYKNNKWQNDIIIFDASWYLPNVNRNPIAEYKNRHIPKALYFDIDEISDKSTELPHMVPSVKDFNKTLNKMGVSNSSHIIVYSVDGIGTSPRVWWLLKLFGHKRVSILNGGLQAWLRINGPTTNVIETLDNKNKEYSAKFNKNLVCNYDEVVKAMHNKNIKIIDARSEGRFKGIEDEPRPGLKKGHIPNSLNIPFNKFISENGYLIKNNEIKEITKAYSIKKDTQIISTCGSGVTACILALALSSIGYNNYKIYDGSWSEWGSINNSLIEK